MIKVLIIDDSAIVRQMLEKSLNDFPDIQVVGTAVDPFVGRDKILKLQPDVVTLDIEMPRMDGLTFLKKLMDHYPIPVIIISSVTAKDSTAAVKSLEIGAFDVVNKPGGSITIQSVVDEVVYKIRQADKVKETYHSRRKVVGLALKKSQPVRSIEALSRIKTTKNVIGIGSSTGGTTALEFLFNNLPPYLPPIVVVQHMPENYTYQFAERLNTFSKLKIKESEDGEALQAGTVYIARGGIHMEVVRKGAVMYIKHRDGEKVSYQKPAVDVLFKSLSETSGENTLSLILTGMGSDGTQGMLLLKKAGARTIAQDEKSSIVWGMPQAAFKAGAVEKVLSLQDMPQAIVDYALTCKDL